MSGLDKMKAQIIAEAQENAKEILAQAHEQSRRFCETPGLFIRYEKAQGST